MSYAVKIDEMIGKYVGEFQAELSLAEEFKKILKTAPALPYGYPSTVYKPKHICQVPGIKHFIAQTGGKLSNNVPRVLSMEMVGDYPLGIYNQDFRNSKICH